MRVQSTRQDPATAAGDPQGQTGGDRLTYTLTEADLGRTVACRVTGTNTAGSGEATSETLYVSAGPAGTAPTTTESPAEVAAWGEEELMALVRAADTPEAGALLVPDTALHTVSRLAALEETLGKPVLTANQVSVWEALRLTGRRVNASGLGELFTREPLVQV